MNTQKKSRIGWRKISRLRVARAEKQILETAKSLSRKDLITFVTIFLWSRHSVAVRHGSFLQFYKKHAGIKYHTRVPKNRQKSVVHRAMSKLSRQKLEEIFKILLGFD